MEEQGLRIVSLLWLSPILPWNVVNWLLAGTALPFRTYCIAWGAMLPETLLWCYLGSLLQSRQAATSGGGSSRPRCGGACWAWGRASQQPRCGR